MSSKHYDIVIVGGGLVGASLSLALSRLDLNIALLDRQAFNEDSIPFRSDPTHFDPRVSAITPKSKDFLESIDVWREIESQRLSPYQEMQVWDGEGTGSIHFSAAEINQPALGYIIENSVILAALYRKLISKRSIDLVAPWEIETIARTDQGINLIAPDGSKLECSLLIAADGANSRIREISGFETREWDYGHNAIVTTVRTEHQHQATAWQRFMATGPLAFLPLAHNGNDEQRYSSIVWSVVPERGDELMALNDKEFSRELECAFEHRLGAIEWVDKRFQFPLRQRHAHSYFKDGVVLVGDAAHTIHPLAGQGVNLGLLDARGLSAELAKGIDAGRALNDERILERYQRNRKGHNMSMMWLMEGFKHLFAEQPPPVIWLRNVGLSTIDGFKLAKNELARQAMGID